MRSGVHRIISTIYHIAIPKPLRKDFNRRRYFYSKYREVASYYSRRELSADQKRSLLFLKKHRFNLDYPRFVYTTDIYSKYSKRYGTVNVLKDKDNGLYYIVHLNKRLYFKRGLSSDEIRHLYCVLLTEMDFDSPHAYSVEPDELYGRVMYDCGVAEGIFPLTHIDKFMHIVLFECDEGWIEALNATFKPYSSKVTIVNKYVSDRTSDGSISIDDYCLQSSLIPTFLKMDIEGCEKEALLGAKSTLSRASNLLCAICCYHKANAETEIVDCMKTFGYSPKYNHGNMIFIFGNEYTPPYLRRGVIRFQLDTVKK